MAPVLRQGWTVKDPNQSADVFTANVPTKFSDGTAANAFTGAEVVVNTRISNGNYDVYERGLAGGGQGNIIYSFNASNSKIDIKNQAAYDRFFDNSTPAGKKNLDTLNKQIKTATYDIAQINAGTDPQRNTDFNNLKKTDAYKSLANQQKPGQRLANAVAPPGGDPTGGVTAAGVPIDGAAISKAVGVKEGTRNKFPGAAGEKPLVYPITLKNELQDVIKFSMIQYRPKTYSSDKFGYGERTRLSPTIEDGKVSGKDTQIIGTVVLPIPNGISDSNAVTWGGADSNAAQAAIGSVVSGSITNGVSGGADAIGNLVKTVYKNTPEVQAAITGLFVDNATQQQGFLARTAGLIINPNLELLFSAPTLRPFNFTFKLASRSPKESETIRSIIRFFKQGMSPIRSQSNLFLKAPHTFQIQYLHKVESISFLNKFKECALQSFSVSYTPEGQYATFNDGAMVSYQITMQFSELEPVFNDDYEDGIGDKATDTEIGF
jgi:hypothetical protein